MQSQMEPVTLKGTQQQGGAMTSLACDNIGILATRDLAYILCVRVCVCTWAVDISCSSFSSGGALLVA